MPTASGYTVNDLLRSFSAGAIERGTEYARQNRISGAEWSPDKHRLVANCRGSGGHGYRTVIDFALHTTPPTVVNARCSCPVGYDCKHAVALIVVEGAKILGEDDGAMWRQYLAEIQADGAPADVDASALPLGLMFTKRAIRDAVAIVEFRPVTLGPRGKWIKTKATWKSLSTASHRQYDSRQVMALHDILRSLTGTTGYFNRDTLTLTTAPPDFWRALSDAVKAGVVLASEGFDTSTVALADEFTLTLDVVRENTGLRLLPKAQLDDRVLDSHQLLTIGRPRASGAFIADDTTLWIGPFASPLTATETSLFANRQSIPIPDDDVLEFADALPTLRRHREVHMPDAVWQPPVISAPTPTLMVTADEHGANLSWHVSYEIDGNTSIFDAGAPARSDRTRDGTAESAAWQSVRPHIERVAAGCATWRHQAIDYIHTHPGLMRATEAFSVLSAISTAPSIDEALALAPLQMLRAPLRIGSAETAVLRNETVPKIETDDTLRVQWRGIDVDYRPPQAPPQISFSAGEDDRTPDNDWLDLSINLNVDDHVLPISDVIAELASGATHMVLGDGTYFSLETPELSRLGDLLAEARALGEFDREKVSTGTLNVTLWEELLELGVVDEQILAWQERCKRLSAARPPQPVEPPAGLNAQLRHYQRDGLDWLSFLWDNQLGGILADDMGLGKTLQTLALISRAVAADPTARFLVVAPTSVIANWAAEVRRFTPGLGVCEVVSTRGRARQSLTDQIGSANIVVTSYTLLRLDFDAFDTIEWSGAIFDEAQFIKNHNGKTHKSARRIRASFKLAITGTPMENNLMELWSLLSVSAPGLFRSPVTFREHFAKPIEAGQAPEQLEVLRRRIRPLMLRRKKTEVVTDLPPKQEQVLTLPLGSKHRKIYDTQLARERQKVLGLLDDWESNQFLILSALTRLRQLSLHPGLVDAEQRDVSSAKVEYLAEQVPELLAEGHSALIFSTFTGFLRLLRETFDAAGIAYAYLDGSMSAKQRKAAVDDFTAGRVSVFLISLKAGGFGLNLTQADYCFVCDPWWNPAAEAQAVDRVHRIGQQRPVNVYRLVSGATIEEKVVELQDRKRELFTAVVDDGDAFSTGITADDVRGLLG
ncbi:putative helicase [Gordonia effusa NBRC 100432]|uniref:Putative helicase n=1 Tax=Gordonia effusa NBRC 100432 TaxID=1077974 RepID=H0QX11_9ACTN|nr:DEAD/DEAH box helicase [Gordonia effusa]GAB17362.1 putative helicase [Gordonia effusa NBRC 100432]